MLHSFDADALRLMCSKSAQIITSPATIHAGDVILYKSDVDYFIIFIYLYTVGLDSPHTLASSLTFICPFISEG